jgi:hypothetical protein
MAPDLFVGDAPPIVLDGEQYLSVVTGQRDADPVRVRVAGDVGQGLLADAKQRGRQLEGQGEVLRHLHRAGDLRAALHVARQPLDGCPQPQIVEDARPQLRGDAADATDGVLDQLDQRGHARRCLAMVRIDLLVEKGQVHAHAGERLPELVVDLARDAYALLLAHRFDVGGQRAQLLA